MPIPPRAPDRKLNPEVERLAYQFTVVRQEAEGLVLGLTDAQLRWKPEPGRWSVAECFSHLNRINAKMLAAIEVSIRAGRQAGQLSEGPFTYGFLSRWFHRVMEPPVKRRFKAPGQFGPEGSIDWAKSQAEWAAAHERLSALLLEANGLDLAAIKTQSPASSWIKYPLGIAFWIQSAHDRRHLWQARQVINDVRFPKAAAVEPALAR